MIMKRPNDTAASVHHFLFSSAKILARTGLSFPKLVRTTLADANVPAVWEPPAEVIERANATRLVRKAGAADWWDLVRRAGADPEWFWPLSVEDTGIEFSEPWT